MPRYQEIADDLRARIQSGEYPEGSKLPTISALQRIYNVPGLNTIRAAQQVLVNEGMLETQQGVGVFVKSAGSLRQIDPRDEITRARDLLAKALAALEMPKHSVTFDLDDDEHLYYVLTEALADFAGRIRLQVQENGGAHQLEWVATAEAALGQIGAA